MQKATPEILPNGNRQSFLFRKFGNEAFLAPFHYHQEYELTWIARGWGKRFVGNRMEDFSDGDFVLIGPNQPHCWKLDPSVRSAKAIVIQFSHSFLGTDFFERPELELIRSMLQASVSGLKFTVDKKPELAGLKAIGRADGARRVLLLLDLLDMLSLKPYKTIGAAAMYDTAADPADTKRINVVMAYIVEHFKDDISLEEVADIASLTPNAFCKYFKRVTRKTFMDTVIQYRLNHASQQLIHTEDSVSAIAIASGFNDLSYFYKMFKSKLGMSPLAYRNSFNH
ncbi:AraC family transcriptional regulator [Parapedobacter pyrenivorans]|uniref:AraC family transcriptional regulator n=1 Tax=Parapedobacter pyrenivorans TaxID=1305674 RepID=A0A917HY77_9SPHI|nr:AraC family transcriptional regulator [Parapedobacter pyrenivorans]GGG97317.1 AraC family transcriptional regulator [Parapedobacter pyrenivorans]